MSSHVLARYPERGGLPRWIGVGFIAGALPVLVFHQGAAALLYALELTQRGNRPGPGRRSPWKSTGFPLPANLIVLETLSP